MTTPATPTGSRADGPGRLRRLLTPRRLAAGLFAGALTLAVPGVAGAAPKTTRSTVVAPTATVAPATVSSVAQRCNNAIAQRFTQIDQLNNQMATAKALTSAHHSALSSELANSRSGLANLQTQITAATTLAQLRTLCPQIVTGYRIYVLETPKVHLTMAADREASVATNLSDIGTKLQAAITTAQGKGQDVGNAPALLSDLNAKVADASSKAGAAGSQVLPLTPAQYNAGTAKPVLESARNGLTQGRGDLLAARSDAAQIVTILKGLEGAGRHLHHGVVIDPARLSSRVGVDIGQSKRDVREAGSTPAGLVPRGWTGPPPPVEPWSITAQGSAGKTVQDGARGRAAQSGRPGVDQGQCGGRVADAARGLHADRAAPGTGSGLGRQAGQRGHRLDGGAAGRMEPGGGLQVVGAGTQRGVGRGGELVGVEGGGLQDHLQRHRCLPAHGRHVRGHRQPVAGHRGDPGR